MLNRCRIFGGYKSVKLINDGIDARHAIRWAPLLVRVIPGEQSLRSVDVIAGFQVTLRNCLPLIISRNGMNYTTAGNATVEANISIRLQRKCSLTAR